MEIHIFQGSNPDLQPADINIVIDVIRAFTVAHYAFLYGAKEIILVNTVEEAFRIKEQEPQSLLAGEIGGLHIEGFDFDNSPKGMMTEQIACKTLVQKTTNGVRATLNCLNANEIFVTGFSNARTTAEYILDQYMQLERNIKMNIIASHPKGDDDLACAEYIKGILLEDCYPDSERVCERIKHCEAAQKFWDAQRTEFDREDILICMKEKKSEFVMKVNKNSKLPMIERFGI